MHLLLLDLHSSVSYLSGPRNEHIIETPLMMVVEAIGMRGLCFLFLY